MGDIRTNLLQTDGFEKLSFFVGMFTSQDKIFKNQISSRS